MKTRNNHFFFEGCRFSLPEIMCTEYESSDFHARTLGSGVDVLINGLAASWQDKHYYVQLDDDFEFLNVRCAYRTRNSSAKNDLTISFALYRLPLPHDRSQKRVEPLCVVNHKVNNRREHLWHFKANTLVFGLEEGEYIIVCNGLEINSPKVAGLPFMRVTMKNDAEELELARKSNLGYDCHLCDDGCWHKASAFGDEDVEPVIFEDDFFNPKESVEDLLGELRSLSDAADIEEMRELNGMVGLESFKHYLHQLVCRVQFRKLRSAIGLENDDEQRFHMILTGNPGTGKTTAARAIGRILHRAGVLSKGDVLWRDRSSLVGRYIGDTENNMNELIAEAKGNVLFIDEAYNLFVKDSEKDFGKQALESILCAAAEPNSDMVIILAGYPDEMNTMLESNPGLKSRFPLSFNFDDFTPDELFEIATRLLVKKKYEMTAEAQTLFRQMIGEALKGNPRDFGNARWVHNTIENYVLIAMIDRVVRLLQEGTLPTADLLRKITLDDVSTARIMMDKESTRTNPTTKPRRIGFAA